jgi:hypothetical protein
VAARRLELGGRALEASVWAGSENWPAMVSAEALGIPPPAPPPPPAAGQDSLDRPGQSDSANPSIFALPGRLGEVESRAAGPGQPLALRARELFESYAPGNAAGFGQRYCGQAVQGLCGRPLDGCDAACLARCLEAPETVRELAAACARMQPGRPVVLRGAARGMRAFSVWQAGRAAVVGAGGLGGDDAVDYEVGRRETRRTTKAKVAADEGQQALPLRQFLARVEGGADLYAVSRPTQAMLAATELLPALGCGGFTAALSATTMWLSAGGTKSVVHKDGKDNMNCLFAGHKRIAFWHPKYQGVIESAALGWRDNRKGPPADGDGVPRYGAYAGAFGEAATIDVTAVDLARFPGWASLQWSEAEVQAGDCVFIPTGWYHHVDSPANATQVGQYPIVTPVRGPLKIQPRYR